MTEYDATRRLGYREEVLEYAAPAVSDVFLLDFQTAADYFGELPGKISPYLDWMQDNWLTVVLTGEIIGGVVAIKMGKYRRGVLWLAAALATIWLGGIR